MDTNYIIQSINLRICTAAFSYIQQSIKLRRERTPDSLTQEKGCTTTAVKSTFSTPKIRGARGLVDTKGKYHRESIFSTPQLRGGGGCACCARSTTLGLRRRIVKYISGVRQQPRTALQTGAKSTPSIKSPRGGVLYPILSKSSG